MIFQDRTRSGRQSAAAPATTNNAPAAAPATTTQQQARPARRQAPAAAPATTARPARPSASAPANNVRRPRPAVPAATASAQAPAQARSYANHGLYNQLNVMDVKPGDKVEITTTWKGSNNTSGTTLYVLTATDQMVRDGDVVRKVQLDYRGTKRVTPVGVDKSWMDVVVTVGETMRSAIGGESAKVSSIEIK